MSCNVFVLVSQYCPSAAASGDDTYLFLFFLLVLSMSKQTVKSTISIKYIKCCEVQVSLTNISLMEHQENTMYCTESTYWKKYWLCILGEKLGLSEQSERLFFFSISSGHNSLRRFGIVSPFSCSVWIWKAHDAISTSCQTRGPSYRLKVLYRSTSLKISSPLVVPPAGRRRCEVVFVQGVDLRSGHVFTSNPFYL